MTTSSQPTKASGTLDTSAFSVPRQLRPRRGRRRTLTVCATTGKKRFRDHDEAIGALHCASNGRRRSESEGTSSRRQEKRTYECNSCHGWHLTSQEQRSAAWDESLGTPSESVA